MYEDLSFVASLERRARGLKKRIIFPEGADERVAQAAARAKELTIAEPILVGAGERVRSTVRHVGLPDNAVNIVDPSSSERADAYASSYAALTGTPLRTARLIAKQPLFYAALALRGGDADGMLGGVEYSSGDFESVCLSVIELRPGIVVASSFFIMQLPGFGGGEKGVLAYADASVNPNPDAKALASIALTTAQSVRDLLGWDPRVAMLSFSTRGSASHDDVQKVVQATAIAKQMAEGSGILVDGEMQADTALVPSTAERKLGTDVGPVAGRANVLIFPDLDAGNTAYKLTQILAGADAYGPILQGFRKPVSDLSRGATVDDIVGAITIIALLAEASSRRSHVTGWL
jgi:phosphate acetyltransferase